MARMIAGMLSRAAAARGASDRRGAGGEAEEETGLFPR